jgi:uncharacterized protein YcaQ
MENTDHYRGRKDSALALYYLWRTGEVMTHHRDHFERVYALTEAVAPAQLMLESGEAEADRFLMKRISAGKDETFAEALAGGFARFVAFLGASKLDGKAIRQPLLRRRAGALKKTN